MAGSRAGNYLGNTEQAAGAQALVHCCQVRVEKRDCQRSILGVWRAEPRSTGHALGRLGASFWDVFGHSKSIKIDLNFDMMFDTILDGCLVCFGRGVRRIVE